MRNFIYEEIDSDITLAIYSATKHQLFPCSFPKRNTTNDKERREEEEGWIDL